MLQRVMMDGIELPRLYIAENNKDAMLAKSKGIPYVRWNQGQDELIRMLLRPILEKKFPHIKWDCVLGKRKRFRTMVNIAESCIEETQDEIVHDIDKASDNVEPKPTYSPVDPEYVDEPEVASEDEDGFITETAGISEGERLFDGGGKMTVEHKLKLEEYMGDMNAYVNLEILQKLRLMPAFIGDILDCVKLNIGMGMYWQEGYNKKRGLPIGRFDASRQKPNLVILDVSGSIPRGISATMISLIDTLRTQLSADLIITGSSSRFYKMGTKLPDPQTIRDQFGYGNESNDFFNILNSELRGKQYGHVFSFGDDDTPYYENFNEQGYSLAGTTVEFVHHYHTGSWYRNNDSKTGYAKWCHMLGKQPLYEFDTSWCTVIKKN